MKILLAIVVAATVAPVSHSHAGPEPAPPPEAQKPARLACEAKGIPVFEIARKDNGTKWQQDAKLYASGAWTFEATEADGKKGKADANCLPPATIKAIRTELDAAKWKTTKLKIHCMAMSPRFTAYYAAGKPVFEAHVCGAEELDADSKKAVDDLEKQLAPAFPKP